MWTLINSVTMVILMLQIIVVYESIRLTCACLLWAEQRIVDDVDFLVKCMRVIREFGGCVTL